ncbi:MAG: peptidase S16 [Actinobacteria bacterium]|nr:MAG: peptidase S16 [Actinomycetota bacterium]
MFPLGSVLFPSMVLPLHIFEPRYRAMVRDVLAGRGSFGVVLIAQGHEVGGRDIRTDVGTLAQVIRAEELPDGRWALVAVGVGRLRVHAWLPDDPYPRARVELWPDEPMADDLEEVQRDNEARLRRVLALASEAGEPAAPATVELAADPVLAGYQMAALAPVSTVEQHRLLSAPGPTERAVALRATLSELELFLRTRL